MILLLTRPESVPGRVTVGDVPATESWSPGTPAGILQTSHCAPGSPCSPKSPTVAPPRVRYPIRLASKSKRPDPTLSGEHFDPRLFSLCNVRPGMTIEQIKTVWGQPTPPGAWASQWPSVKILEEAGIFFAQGRRYADTRSYSDNYGVQSLCARGDDCTLEYNGRIVLRVGSARGEGRKLFGECTWTRGVEPDDGWAWRNPHWIVLLVLYISKGSCDRNGSITAIELRKVEYRD